MQVLLQCKGLDSPTLQHSHILKHKKAKKLVQCVSKNFMNDDFITVPFIISNRKILNVGYFVLIVDLVCTPQQAGISL